MHPDEFTQLWLQRYSDCPPVGHLMREAFEEQWFRVHTLPNSKRYAESQKEEDEILRRHNSVLDALIGKDGKFVLVFTHYSGNIDPSISPDHCSLLGFPGKHFLGLPQSEFDPDIEEEFSWHFYMSTHQWSSGSMDDLLRMIATERIANILLVAIDQNCAYHPYDGGGEVFVDNVSRREGLLRRFKVWLSPRSDGL